MARSGQREHARFGRALLAAALGLACSSKAPVGSAAQANAGTTASNAGQANGSSGSTPSAGGTGPILVIPDAGVDSDAGLPSGNECGSSCPSGQTCMPEVCDGVDNNCDGVIDNVDKNSDGVCDCLLIATLGAPGVWGQGDVFSTWLSSRSDVGAASLGDQALTADLLAKYEVIVAQDLSNNHAYSSDEVAALQAWVKAGGGLMTLIGYADPGEAANVNQLLAPFGMSYGDQQILPANGNSTFPVTEWVLHPIDQGVHAIGVDNGYAVLGTGTVIATGDGNNIGNAQEVLPGHVFTWGDEWITYDSEWQQHPDYQVQLFWLNAIKWLTAANKCQVAIPPSIVK